MTLRKRANRTVAVVAFDGISPFHLSVPCAVFGEDRSAGGVPRYEVVVCAAETRPIRTSAGFSIGGVRPLADLRRAGTVIVPSWRDPLEAPPPALLAALRAAHRRGARVVGLCLGSFVLAAAGLLDARRATTHWSWAAEFARLHPAVALDASVLYVDEGDILTSAGTAAGIDCCLHLLRKDCGAEAASYVARRMVVPPHRQGGQAQYIEAPLPAGGTPDRLAQALDWALRHLDQPLDLDSLARRAAMSRRTFTRRFRDRTGTTFLQWLLAQRIAHAQRLLESSARPIERIAEMAGFGNAASMRQRFARSLGTSPAAYRREFRGG